jgi:hypothetical protein
MKKQKMCDECGQRRAVYIRRVYKFRGQTRVRSDKNHTLCIRCNNSQYQSLLQLTINGI